MIYTYRANLRTAMCRQLAFSITEMLIVLVIMSAMMAYAVPAMNGYITKAKVTTSVNEFVTSVAYARNEAVTRGKVVNVCPYVDPIPTTSTDACGGNWALGWAVTTLDDAGVPIVLRVHQLDSLITITSGLTRYSFIPPIGLPATARAGGGMTLLTGNSTIKFCSNYGRENIIREITLLPQGRTSVAVSTTNC